jgi:hypothetical protein
MRRSVTTGRSCAIRRPTRARCNRFDAGLKPPPGMLRPAMLFAAKCYWPGVTEADSDTIAQRTDAVGSTTTGEPVNYLGSLLFTDDELVLCFFDGPSRPAVKLASERAGVASERLMGSIWLAASQSTEGEPSR